MGSIHALLSLFAELGADALAPARCAACDARVALRTVFCPACARELMPAASVALPDVAPFVYGGAIARAITRFKYEDRPDLARPLAHLALRGAPALEASRPNVVVPVPLYPSRLAERRFNQAALLARVVAAHLGADFAPLALARLRDTPRQASLDRDARAKNVAAAFRVSRAGEIAGRRVLLVDDVRTTGATLRECARALTASGASSALSLVIAAAE